MVTSPDILVICLVLSFDTDVGEATRDFSVLLFFRVLLLVGASKLGWFRGRGLE